MGLVKNLKIKINKSKVNHKNNKLNNIMDIHMRVTNKIITTIMLIKGLKKIINKIKSNKITLINLLKNKILITNMKVHKSSTNLLLKKINKKQRYIKVLEYLRVN